MGSIRNQTLAFVSNYCKKHECKDCEIANILIYPDGKKYYVCGLNTKPSRWFANEEVKNGKN